MHRATVAARHDFLLGDDGLAACVIDRRGNEGMELGIDFSDALREQVDILDGRQLARADQP